MHLDALKKKGIRVLTTPPELLYALTRHWWVILLCLIAGTVVMVAKAGD